MEKRPIKRLSKSAQEFIKGGARRRIRRVGIALRRRRSSG